MYFVEVSTDGTITLTPEKSSHNETSLFYRLPAIQDGVETWEADGVSAIRQGDVVQMYVRSYQSKNDTVVLGTLPESMRPAMNIIQPVPLGKFFLNGTMSKFRVENLKLTGKTSYYGTEIGDRQTIIGSRVIDIYFEVENPLEYYVLAYLRNPDGSSLLSDGTSGGKWSDAGQQIVLPKYLSTRASLTGADYKAKTNYLTPGKHKVCAHFEGYYSGKVEKIDSRYTFVPLSEAVYTEDVEFELEVLPFFIDEVEITYSSDTNSYNVADGSDADVGFCLEVTPDPLEDCSLLVYDGEEIIFSDQDALTAGDPRTAYYTIRPSSFENGHPWTEADVGNKALTFVLVCGDSRVSKTVQIKITNGGTA